MDSHICYLFVVIMSGFVRIYATNVLTTMKIINDTTITTIMKTSTLGQNVNASIDTTEQITTDKNKSEAVDTEVHACNYTDETASPLKSSTFPITQNATQTSFSVQMEDTTASGLGMLFSRGQTRTTIKVSSIRTSSKITNDNSTASVNQFSQHGSYFNLTKSSPETRTNTSKVSVITAVVGADPTNGTDTNSTDSASTTVPTMNKISTNLPTMAPKVTTTTKPISCPTGNCNGNETCFNTSSFIGTTKPCTAGQMCAVNETKGNGTNTYDALCLSTEKCTKITDAGTGACCKTDGCTPDLKAAQANAKAGSGGGGGGSDYLRINVNAFVCVAFIALKNIYGYV